MVSKDEEYIKLFYNLFVNTIRLRGGEKRHFFPFEFFKKISLSFHSYFCFSKFKEEVLAGALFLKYGNFSHYFLGGLSEKGYKTKGSTHFIFWSFIKNEFNKIRYFSLGGGRGGEDSLFHFKLGFSRKTKSYFISRKIYFKKVYEELVEEFLKYKKLKERPKLFPEYRDI